MNQNKLKVGMIVKVVNGEAFGNKSGTITKILSKQGRSTDQDVKFGAPLYREGSPYILCLPCTYPYRRRTFNNQPICYEYVEDLIPATQEEKKMFRKGIYLLNNDSLLNVGATLTNSL